MQSLSACSELCTMLGLERATHTHATSSVGSVLLLCLDAQVTADPHLQAPDDASIAMWNIMTEHVNLLQAGLLHGVLEVDVLREPHLFTHECGTTHNTQLVTLALKAAYHTCRTLQEQAYHVRAVLLVCGYKCPCTYP